MHHVFDKIYNKIYIHLIYWKLINCSSKVDNFGLIFYWRLNYATVVIAKYYYIF